MYLAEIRGKLSRENENKEDILTSNVFSFFKYSSRTAFLYPFIQSLGLEVTPGDAQEAEFRFWPRYEDGTEPDLVLLIGNYYLLIEAKYHSGFGKEKPTLKGQLRREIVVGNTEARILSKEFRIFAVTADHFEKPDIKKDVPREYLPCYRWLNWQRIALFIYQTLESSQDLSPETRYFAEDLYDLFLKKNLRGYEGTKVLKKVSPLQIQEGYIFLNASTASFRGDFIGFLQAFELEVKPVIVPERVFFAAATAAYRGDFIGFIESLHSTHLKTKPPTIFFNQHPKQPLKQQPKLQPHPFFQLHKPIDPLKFFPGEVFYKRRRNEPK